MAPFNSFAEYAPDPNSETKAKDARSTTMGRCATSPAACIWTKFQRRPRHEIEAGAGLVYGFLTTTANAIVESLHPKAMPAVRPSLRPMKSATFGCVRRGTRPRTLQRLLPQ